MNNNKIAFKLSCSSEIEDYGDIRYQIEEEGGEQYLKRILAIITDDKGKEIGEMTGYVLFTDIILSDMTDSFWVMDNISHLLYNVHSYIDNNKKMFFDKQRVLYLNRLSLYEENYSKELEEKVLEFLLNVYKTVIYSLGSTELTDKDFFDNQDGAYINYWGDKLKKSYWTYSSNLGLYYKTLL